jgi:hypothetical protein
MKAWFSQPDNSFSSYYQNDPGTGKFVRIRLELGRDIPEDATDATVVQYQPKRVVGFSAEDFYVEGESPGKYWSLNDNGQLCYKNTPLSSDPQPGLWVYDATNPKIDVHFGNRVAVNPPKLPGGIEPDHLALLANDTMLNEENIILSGPEATDAGLAGAIQEEVCRIVGEPDFTAITDGDIADTLRSQIRRISDNATLDSRSSTDKALEEVGVTSELINEQLGDGRFTPTEDVEQAFLSFEDSVSQALAADNNNVPQKQAEIGIAEHALDTVIENLGTTMNETISRELESTREALNEADQQAAEWEATVQPYESLENTTDIASYEEELDLPTDVVEEFS